MLEGKKGKVEAGVNDRVEEAGVLVVAGGGARWRTEGKGL